MMVYVYNVMVDGVIRYIGKGRGARLSTHVIKARRAAARRVRTDRLHPRMYRNLVAAIRAGSKINERVIAFDLSDQEARRLESEIIGSFHQRRPGQLWNTVDERFMDSRFLPEKWDHPEHPLYKLQRPNS